MVAMKNRNENIKEIPNAVQGRPKLSRKNFTITNPKKASPNTNNHRINKTAAIKDHSINFVFVLLIF